MAKDNTQTIGQLVGHTGVRDAIHCPIMSVVAKSTLSPGAPIIITASGEAVQGMDAVGIVDPFMQRNVACGENVWAWIRPGSISTLTHKWTHKRIPDMAEVVPENEAARVRLEAFATGELEVTLAKMLDVIDDCANRDGDPLYSHSYESLGVYDGFWEDYTLYTGKPDPTKSTHFYGFFTCGGCS